MKILMIYQIYKIILAMIIIVIGFVLLKFINNNIKTIILNTNVDKTFVSFSIQLINIAAIVILLLFTLSTLEISTTPLIAGITAIMFGVGISLKNSASNLASGLLIVSIRPFKISDIIELKNIYGTVQNIELAFCTILTPDGKEIKIPNTVVTSSIITNFSISKFRRNDFVIAIDCFNDFNKAKKVLYYILNNDDRVINNNNNKSIVRIINISENNIIKIMARYWTKRTDYLETKYYVSEQVIKLFVKNNIIIPISCKFCEIRNKN